LTYVLWLLAVIILLPLASIYLPGYQYRMEKIFPAPPVEPIDFTKLRKISKPNQYLVCPRGHCIETPDIIARTYQVDATKLAESWHSIVMAAPDVTERARNDAMGMMEYVQRSNRMRYPDLISVEFITRPEGQSTIAIYSRSVYGYSDDGVNKARITNWLTKLDEALTP
jgi:uncharacterized protein (DUF1499 family)